MQEAALKILGNIFLSVLNFKGISFKDLKLWLIKGVKSDACELRVFAKPVTLCLCINYYNF